MLAVILEILNIKVAIAIEIPSFAEIKGIIGLSMPVYMSFIKCAPESQTRGNFPDLFITLTLSPKNQEKST